ncbi:mannosyl-oligosaccharide alpha-1,2-mannosidase [Xylographa trunciseda]|nr:mannosyl-oligosaccharide alpha-1,2-mannosidase [Xylographa trunciseda]
MARGKSRSFRLFAPNTLVAGLFFLAMILLWRNGSQNGLDTYPIASVVDWDARRQEVKEVFATSWDAYSKYAWGQDQFHPISKTGSQMSPQGLGWIIVDSLDTMMIMNLTSQLSDAREWLLQNLTYDQDQEVNTFETTIRMLGGLLSAHYLATQLPDIFSRQDYIYLNKSIDLAERLLGAYESRSGIPYASINLGSELAFLRILMLEMKYLAYLTGKEIYWRKSEEVMRVLDDNGMQDGLLPIFVHPDTGKFTSSEIRLGSRGDSYYEYLIKQYMQTGETIYLEMWSQALAGIQRHMITSTKDSKLQFVAELPRGIGSVLSPKMDHLVCFLPGSIALGATGGLTTAEARRLPNYWSAEEDQQMQLARELMKTCWGMYAVTETGLAPEIAWFEADDAALQPMTSTGPSPSSSNSETAWKKDYIVKPLDAHNLQRPETVESLFMMYRITNDPIYREWGWKIFKAFQKYGILEDGQGYTSLDNVNAVPPLRRDNMESFWLAETLKYLYLLFSPTDFLPLDGIVFNTEAHIFPRIKQDRFQTGWKRIKRSRE